MAESYAKLAEIVAPYENQVLTSKMFAALIRSEARKTDTDGNVIFDYVAAIGTSPAFFASTSPVDATAKKNGTGNAPVLFLPTATGYKVLAPAEQYWPAGKRGTRSTVSDAELLKQLEHLKAENAALKATTK